VTRSEQLTVANPLAGKFQETPDNLSPGPDEMPALDQGFSKIRR